VGQFGKTFLIHKFRTMYANAGPSGSLITVANDPRVTRIGHVLRKYKLDELPQLLDVLAGHMSLVGPRPEVRQYVAAYPEEIRAIVLSVPPGITDLASIEFRDEGALLQNSAESDREYREKILPIKLDYYVRYVKSRSFLGDFALILKTIRAVWG
jgi:lipopolysaccharide/colanic/teichoic acid biosynthesis glycosyltransferase